MLLHNFCWHCVLLNHIYDSSPEVYVRTTWIEMNLLVSVQHETPQLYFCYPTPRISMTKKRSRIVYRIKFWFYRTVGNSIWLKILPKLRLLWKIYLQMRIIIGGTLLWWFAGTRTIFAVIFSRCTVAFSLKNSPKYIKIWCLFDH